MHGRLSLSQQNLHIHLSEENIRLLELFILYVYFDKNHRYTDLNEARCTSFFKSPDLKLKYMVLTKVALLEYIKRSAYQACCLWRECFDNAFLPGL